MKYVISSIISLGLFLNYSVSCKLGYKYCQSEKYYAPSGPLYTESILRLDNTVKLFTIDDYLFLDKDHKILYQHDSSQGKFSIMNDRLILNFDSMEKNDTFLVRRYSIKYVSDDYNIVYNKCQ